MNVKTCFNKTLLVLRKNSPKILVGTSVVSGTGAVVCAVAATPKAMAIVTQHKEKRAWLNELHEQKSVFSSKTNTYEAYTDKDYKKDLRKLYLKTSCKLAKLYTPSALLLSSSIASTIASHNIMNGRNKLLSNELAAAAAQAAAYRNRVREVLGEEKEQDLWDNVKEEEKTNPETGEKEVSKVKRGPSGNLTFDALFNEGCRSWEPNATLNVAFLMGAEDYFTDKLHKSGVVFLDEVYRYLGITKDIIGNEKMKMAHMVGWVYDPKNKNIDNYVSFGLRTPEGNVKRFVLDQKLRNEPNFWLSFNIAGNIVDGKKNNSYDYTYYMNEPLYF